MDLADTSQFETVLTETQKYVSNNNMDPLTPLANRTPSRPFSLPLPSKVLQGSEQTSSTKKHTSKVQKLAILNWLDNEENLNLITGASSKGSKMVAGRSLRKMDAYKSLAAHVNNNTNSSWDSSSCKNRFETWMKQFKDAKEKSLRTGFGVDDADRASGVTSISQKLTKLCDFYDKLDEYFGNRQNVNPECVNESGTQDSSHSSNLTEVS
jgi:hypothetical protein